MLLRHEGWQRNLKKTYRVYRELGLQLRDKTPKRRVKAKLRNDRRPATRRNETRAMDVVSSSGRDGDLGGLFARRDRTGGARIAAVRAVPASAGIRQRDHLGRVKLRRLPGAMPRTDHPSDATANLPLFQQTFSKPRNER